MAHSIDEIADGYFRYLETKDEVYFWAWLAVDDLCQSLPNGMEITLRLIEVAPTKWFRDCVAAHALENLVSRHGIPAVTRIGQLAENSRPLRLALPIINVSEDSNAFSDWELLLVQYGESDGSHAL